ncbi:MAG: hypothetical protein AAF490_06445 [Chloroflexota bacterium]
MWTKNKTSISIVFFLSVSIVFVLQACQYAPAVQGNSLVDTIHVTQPSLLQGYQLNVLNFLDRLPPCRYEILGWETDTTLYYEETCYKNTRGTGNVPPDSDGRPIAHQIVLKVNLEDGNREIVTHSPELFVHHGADILNFVENKPNNSLHSNFVGQVFVSPNQTTIALVSKHVYGPHDILVFMLPPT